MKEKDNPQGYNLAIYYIYGYYLLIVPGKINRRMSCSEGIEFFYEQCGTEFSSKVGVVIHKKAEHEEVKFTCIESGQKFSQNRHLAEHKRAVHEGFKFPCEQCGKEFLFIGDVVKHKRAVHEGVTFPCGKCNYQATAKGRFFLKGPYC